MSQTESGVRRRKSYDDLCDLQFVPLESSSLLRQFVPWCNDTLTVEVFTAIQTNVLLVHFL